MMLMLELAIAGSCWIGRLVPHAFKFYFESHNVLHTPTENCSTCQHSAQIDFSGICWFLCRDRDGKVTPEEVAAAANYLKDTIGTDGVQELISNLPKDKGAYIQHYCLSYWWKGYGISYVLLYRLAFFFMPCRGEYPCGRHCEIGITNRGKQWTWRSATMMWTAGTFLAVRTQRSIHFRGNWPSELKAVSLVDLNFKRQDGHFLFRLAGAEKVVQ